MQLAPRQRRLEHVRGVHRAFGFTGADQRVQFVDEQDDVACALGELLQHGLEPFLEFAAILRAREQRARSSASKRLFFERLGHVALDDALREPFDNRGLADTRLADQNRIVFGAAGQHLDGAPDLFVSADHRIELVLPRLFGEIARVFLERVIALLGRRRVRQFALCVCR